MLNFNWKDIVFEFQDGNHFNVEKAVYDQIHECEQLFRFAKGIIPLKDCKEIMGYIRDEKVFSIEFGHGSKNFDTDLVKYINERHRKHLLKMKEKANI